MNPKIQRPLLALAFGLEIGLLAILILWMVSAYAGSPSATVPDPRVVAGKVQPDSFYGPSEAAFNVVEAVEFPKKSLRTWHLVTTSIDQESFLAAHVGYPVLAVGRRGERGGQFYFLVDAVRENR